MQFSHFTSPPNTKSDLLRLGIKVRRNRSKNSEGSDKSPEKDTSVEEGLLKISSTLTQTKATSGEPDSHVDSKLITKAASNTEVHFRTDPEVTSKTETRKQTEDRLGNQTEHTSRSSTIPLATENHKPPKAISDNLTANSNPSISSLVCCDYADSSDTSDDLA